MVNLGEMLRYAQHDERPDLRQSGCLSECEGSASPQDHLEALSSSSTHGQG